MRVTGKMALPYRPGSIKWDATDHLRVLLIQGFNPKHSCVLIITNRIGKTKVFMFSRFYFYGPKVTIHVFNRLIFDLLKVTFGYLFYVKTKLNLYLENMLEIIFKVIFLKVQLG